MLGYVASQMPSRSSRTSMTWALTPNLGATLSAKADAIGATVFDLKAVNPNVVVKLDTRTPAEVIQSIEDQGKIVAKSFQTLRALLQS
jgi:hypothetical protein